MFVDEKMVSNCIRTVYQDLGELALFLLKGRL